MFQCPKCQCKLVDGVSVCPECGCEISSNAEKLDAVDAGPTIRLLEDTIDLEDGSSIERLANDLGFDQVKIDRTSQASLEETTDLPLKFGEQSANPSTSDSDAVNQFDLSETNKTISFELDKTVDLTGGLPVSPPKNEAFQSQEETCDVPSELRSVADDELESESDLQSTLDDASMATIDLPEAVSEAMPDGAPSDGVQKEEKGSIPGVIEVDLNTGTMKEPEVAEPAVPSSSAEDRSDTIEIESMEPQNANDQTAIIGDQGEYLSGDEYGTLGYTAPLFPTIVKARPVDDAGDNSATVDLDDSSEQDSATIDFGTAALAANGLFAADSRVQGTVPYSTEEIAAAQAETGRSGSSGHLRRVWGGVGGSSANPSHTLKAISAKASDSIFERVSARVLVSDNQDEIIGLATQRAKDKERDQRVVSECLRTACAASAPISDYQINGYLGRGAMGVVLQARQSAIGRDVAIKMIQPSADGTRTNSSTRDMQKKFLYEAQITGKLDHPNIVPIYELGISNNVLFYAMKKIVGKEWKDNIGKLSKEENLDILMKVADAMALSHQRGIIHRDLKPENIMLGPFGEVLVTDWGCAIDLRLKETFSGAGSPPWMAPEMALHQQNAIGPCSDIYLLGAILFQIVAGFPPHGGRTVMEVLLAASRNQILPTKKNDPLLKIAMKAMATEPKDRFPTVEEMQAAIRQYRKHAESIALTDRSQSTLELAQGSKDYERFSRAIFGFRDALELWPENSTASEGLKNARLGYGRCAFERKDYDLCLATVERQYPDENELYVQAESAKRAVIQREARFKTMRKALAAVVLIGLATSSIAAGVAWYQKSEADKQRQVAVEQTIEADKARVEAERQEGIAKSEKDIADKAKVEAERQEGIAKTEKEIADKAKVEAERQEGIAKAEKEFADKAKTEAERQEGIARAEKEQADKARLESQRRAAEVELAGIQSNLALSLGQVDQLDLDRAGQTLHSLATESSYVSLAAQGVPLLKNWAWNRVNLLSNADLLQQPLGQSISAVAFSQQANRGVVALSRNGSTVLQVVRIEQNQLVSDSSRALDLGASGVESASISPDGKSVLYSVSGQVNNNQPKLYKWDVDSRTSSPIVSAAGRSFQGFVATDAVDIAGLNRGLWVWNRHQLDSKPDEIKSVQGRMLSIQLLAQDNVLVLAEMPNGQRFPHIVSLREKGAHQYLRTQKALGAERLSAVAFANGKLILGTESGKMFAQPFTFNSSVAGPDGDRGIDIDSRNLIEIPQQHFSKIRSIRPHSDGTLLTVAEEPNVQVWKPIEAEYGWRHEIRLAGTTRNVQRTDFAGNSNLVLAIAEDSRPIVWDINRQRQRQQARRVNSRGEAETYAAPVANVVTSSDGRRAVSILENGKIDRWDIQTGLTDHQGEVPLSYIGHNPDAQFVDMAIDTQAGIMITSARLPIRMDQVSRVSQTQKSEKKFEWDWEFVKWDLNSLQMVDRWSGRSSEEQAISLAGKGRYVLYGSDSQTRIQNLSEKQEFQRDDFGAFFGVSHPTSTNLMMLVKLNGAVLLADVDNLEASWKNPAFQLSEKDFVQIATNGNRPVIGQWTPSGDRFYMVWESGRVTELSWDNRKLAIVRDSGPDGARLDISIGSEDKGEGKSSTIRVGSRWDIDMKVRTAKGYNLVYVLHRFPGREGLTRLTRLAFPQGSGQVLTSQSDAELESHYCVLSDEQTPEAVTMPLAIALKRWPSLQGEIAGIRTVGNDTFVATKAGVVHRINSTKQGVQVLGATKVLAGTGDRSGNTIATLHEGGLIWRADWTGGNWKWRQLPMVSPNTRSIAMSPDGSQLAVSSDDAVKLISAETGIEQSAVITGSALVQWDRSADVAASRLATVDAAGRVQIIENGKPREVGRIPVSNSAKGIHFFRESWNDPNKVKTGWLLVHTSSDTKDELMYFNEDPNLVDQNQSLSLTGKVSAIECSPSEGLIAVGGYGNVTIYFSAPTLGEAGKELFGLQGHAGADVRLLHFTSDGKTLLTGDSSGRLFGWLSEDALAKRTSN